jgi:phage-related protein
MKLLSCVTAFVTLTENSRNNSRGDIECAGDTVTYNCSVLSNSEDVTIMWFITIPGEETFSTKYNGSSDVNSVSYLGSNVTTTLTVFTDQEYIESTIKLTVLDYLDMNGTVLECGSAHLDSEVTIVYINKSGTVTCKAMNMLQMCHAWG